MSLENLLAQNDLIEKTREATKCKLEQGTLLMQPIESHESHCLARIETCEQWREDDGAI